MQITSETANPVTQRAWSVLGKVVNRKTIFHRANLAYWGISGFKERIDRGHGFLRASLGTGVDILLWSKIPLVMWGLTGWGAAKSLGEATYDLYYSRQAWFASNYGAMAANRLIDLESNATMRQRAIQAISQSRLNARVALGNEASEFAVMNNLTTRRFGAARRGFTPNFRHPF